MIMNLDVFREIVGLTVYIDVVNGSFVIIGSLLEDPCLAMPLIL